MPLTSRIINADGEELFCEYSLAQENVIIMHGAGQARLDRYHYFAEKLMARDKGVVLFDFSGHGRSSGTTAELSLDRRKHQVKAVIDTIVPADSLLYLAGFSMSGQTVCDLLPEYGHRTNAILLTAAATYRSDVYDLPFGSEEFTQKIREGKWETSRAKHYLQQYKGKTIVAIGSNDEVIPRGVTELLVASAKHPVYIEFPDATHATATWLREHNEEFDNLLAEFIA